MKKKIFTLALLLQFCFAVGQGTILNYSFEPVYPTDQDSITFYVDLSFTSGDCAMSSSGVSKNGNTIQANALHCLGMLTFICTKTDTFKIAPLPAGIYDFEMTLSSGFGIPCSPGFVADDTLTFQFGVIATTPIRVIKDGNNFQIYPNPAKNLVTLEMDQDLPAQISIHNALGQLVFENAIHAKTYSVNTQEFAKGLYFYTVKTENYQNTHKLIIE